MINADERGVYVSDLLCVVDYFLGDELAINNNLLR